MSISISYIDRPKAEIEVYRQTPVIHPDLPIADYWANQHIRPVVSTLGFEGPEDLFEKRCQHIVSSTQGNANLLSIGSGDVGPNFLLECT